MQTSQYPELDIGLEKNPNKSLQMQILGGKHVMTHRICTRHVEETLQRNRVLLDGTCNSATYASINMSVSGGPTAVVNDASIRQNNKTLTVLRAKGIG